MDLNFDYREFQRESMERLARIYAESCNETENLEETDKTFSKIQKLLDCQSMEKCHPYLFTLDRANVNEEDRRKIDELYECGIKRGFIKEEDQIKTECDHMEDDDCDSPLCGGPESPITDRPMTTPPTPGVETRPTFTVLYSAMKDGTVKLGQFYSLASDNNGAKEDCLSQLQAAGYNSITIMAIEQNTDAVDQNVEQTDPGANLYGMYEDDSKEFEDQETGNTSDTNSSNKEEKKEETQPDFGGGVDDNQDSDTQNSDNETSSTEETSSTDDSNSEEASDDNNEEKQEGDAQPEETSDEKKEDASSDSENDDSNDKKDDEKTEDTESKDDSKDKSEDSEEKSDDSKDEDGEDKKKLTASEKTELKDEYTKLFKQILEKVSTEKSVSEMSLSERTDFWTKLSEKWTKNDPSEFLSDKDQEKLNKTVAKPEEKESK